MTDVTCPHGVRRSICSECESDVQKELQQRRSPLAETSLRAFYSTPFSEVNHPAYYNTGKIEVITFIEDQQLNFHLGNCVKYICRAGKKDKEIVNDLKKAAWYLQRQIEQLEKTNES